MCPPASSICTGAIRLDRETGKVDRVRAVKHTIKDGMVFDSGKLLGQIRDMVEKAKQETGIEVTIPPMLYPTVE